MGFYYINNEYLDYLRAVEPKIMKNSYSNGKEKFVFGILLKIEELNYYAPVSSIKDYQLNKDGEIIKQLKRKVLPIKDEKKIIALIRFDFMFPVKNGDLREVKINSLDKIYDLKYKNLVLKENLFCKKNSTEISLKAIKIYEKSLKPGHYFNIQCCDHELLNKKCKEWIEAERI